MGESYQLWGISFLSESECTILLQTQKKKILHFDSHSTESNKQMFCMIRTAFPKHWGPIFAPNWSRFSHTVFKKLIWKRHLCLFRRPGPLSIAVLLRESALCAWSKECSSFDKSTPNIAPLDLSSRPQSSPTVREKRSFFASMCACHTNERKCSIKAMLQCMWFNNPIKSSLWVRQCQRSSYMWPILQLMALKGSFHTMKVNKLKMILYQVGCSATTYYCSTLTRVEDICTVTLQLNQCDNPTCSAKTDSQQLLFQSGVFKLPVTPPQGGRGRVGYEVQSQRWEAVILQKAGGAGNDNRLVSWIKHTKQVLLWGAENRAPKQL